MERFVFGYPTEDDVVLFEVDKKEKLGDGVDGAYKCRDIASGEKFALKIYEIKNAGQKRQILNDLRTKQSIRDHEHIVKYHNVIETQEQIYVLMELIPGKDLFTHIVDCSQSNQTGGGLAEDKAAKLFAQICGALRFLHDSDIMHGDVKPENVMVVDPDGDSPKAKLIDFGFACFLDGQEVSEENAQEGGDVSRTKAMEKHCVYDIYSPPEAMGIVQASTTKEVDMFRLGCTLYVMVMATWPFLEGKESIERRKAGMVMPYPNWKKLSPEVQDLITRLCRDRLKVEEVLKHPWLEKHGLAVS
jgi:serine/threonine protein kinase